MAVSLQLLLAWKNILSVHQPLAESEWLVASGKWLVHPCEYFSWRIYDEERSGQ
jgi:hypothetical protein